MLHPCKFFGVPEQTVLFLIMFNRNEFKRSFLVVEVCKFCDSTFYNMQAL